MPTILQIDPAPGYEQLSLTELRKLLHTARRITPERDSPIGLYDRQEQLLATAPSDSKDFLQRWLMPRRCHLYTYDGVPELPTELLEAVVAAGKRLIDDGIAYGSIWHQWHARISMLPWQQATLKP